MTSRRNYKTAVSIYINNLYGIVIVTKPTDKLPQKGLLVPNERPPVTNKVNRSPAEVGVGVFCDASGTYYSYMDRGMLRLTGSPANWPPMSPVSPDRFAVEDAAVIEKLPAIEAPDSQINPPRGRLGSDIVDRILGRHPRLEFPVIETGK